MTLIHIPGSVPSSKNSRMMTSSGLFIASKATQKFRKTTAWYWKMHKEAFLKTIANKPKPYLIGMHFVRSTKHAFDFNNPCQTIQDEMVKHGWLTDDNMLEMVPVPLKINNRYYSIDKVNCGVYIAVLDDLGTEPITLKYLKHNGITEENTDTDT